MVLETWVQSQVVSYQRLKKWYLIPPCLTLSIIRYRSKVKWSNPGKGVVPSHTPWCSSYHKGSLQVTLDYNRQLYNNRLIRQAGRVFANGLGDLGSIPCPIIPKTLKMVLIPPCLTLNNIGYVSRLKWSNPGKGVVPSPTPCCSSYWKESLLVALDYSHQLYLLLLLPWERNGPQKESDGVYDDITGCTTFRLVLQFFIKLNLIIFNFKKESLET